MKSLSQYVFEALEDYMITEAFNSKTISKLFQQQKKSNYEEALFFINPNMSWSDLDDVIYTGIVPKKDPFKFYKDVVFKGYFEYKPSLRPDGNPLIFVIQKISDDDLEKPISFKDYETDDLTSTTEKLIKNKKLAIIFYNSNNKENSKVFIIKDSSKDKIEKIYKDGCSKVISQYLEDRKHDLSRWSRSETITKRWNELVDKYAKIIEKKYSGIVKSIDAWCKSLGIKSDNLFKKLFNKDNDTNVDNIVLTATALAIHDACLININNPTDDRKKQRIESFIKDYGDSDYVKFLKYLAEQDDIKKVEKITHKFN